MRCSRTPAVVITLLLSLAGTAGAQTMPAYDVSAGYSFLRDHDIDENLHGWLFSYTGNLTGLFAVVGEVGGNYSSPSFAGTTIDLSVHSFMGGGKVASRRSARVTPFGQVLVGGVRGSISLLGLGESSTEFALQYGGGADIWMRSNVGVRAGIDERTIFAGGETTQETRFNVGIVWAGGMR
jgi:hypothetical protein